MTNDFEPAVKFTDEEVEQQRLESLAQTAAEQDTSIDDLVEYNRPESFGCHEVLQMASVFSDSVDRHLCEHPAILADPNWYRLAHEAQLALWNLYQAIGEKHLNTGSDEPA